MRNRSIPVMVYLNAEEYGKLQNDLKKTGLTKSKYLRALIMGRRIKERLQPDYYRLCTVVSRVGSNVNQIARIANAHPESVQDVARVEYLLCELIRMVHDLAETE